MGNWFKNLMEEGKRRSNEYNKEQGYNKEKVDSLLNECQDRLNISQELLEDIAHLIGKDKCKCSCYCNNLNKNIHLSKEEKMRIREEHLKKYNTPKPRYYYKGDEFIDTDYRSYVKIYWNDNTVTKATCVPGDHFNYGYGVLIATVKKFVKNIDLDLLDYAIDRISTNKDKEVLKIYILELLIKNIAGNRCLQDVHKEADRKDLQKTVSYNILENMLKDYVLNHYKNY